ncbi:uncharacterized protein K452DRAFT_278598 [Aplosporella prunicola CBS 121167]|uniref:Uncharacterized protein n=1 Tax=Aplosporella prunicola CBS 121167 TaxID=1176127 RepID=A0A6A6B000_9PEZI|nr:uncharacterized protein K452DRAFT_278598 [Aplosporella prunicola CBS 121167]KAF2137370.1 hypothetical protein K452DRAFT_278598 [Aplosporella prunicola CBS 121167]
MASNNQTNRPLSPALMADAYTIGLITFLGFELAAVQAILDEEQDEPSDFEQISADDNKYFWGRIGKHNVVVAASQSGLYGFASAAMVVTSMIRSFPSIRFGLLIGIGGGIPSSGKGPDIRLGDIAVSNPGGRHGGVCIGYHAKPPVVLLEAIAKLKADYMTGDSKLPDIVENLQSRMSEFDPGFSYQQEDNDTFFESTFDHLGGEDCTECHESGAEHLVARKARGFSKPVVHYGLIASGNGLVKDASHRDKLVAALKKRTGAECICFEMEAGGLMANFPCLIIRGICDYCDSHKNDRWQKYAAMTAAAYARELLEVISATRVVKTRNAVEAITSLHSDIKRVEEHIWEWLHPVDALTNYREALRLRHPDTGRWFLESDSFQLWKTKPGSFLWLHGNPGCGKTILSTSIIERLSENKPLYFYFSFTNTNTQSVESVIRVLSSQLYMNFGASRESMNSLYTSCGNGRQQPSIEALQKVFQDMVEQVGEVWIILDALDECQEPSQIELLLSWVENLQSQKTNIHFLITSRQEQDIKSTLAKWDHEQKQTISIQSDLVEEDIRKYIHMRVRGSEGPERWQRRPDIQDEIEDTLTKKANGMFRWVSLQLDTLERCPDIISTRKALTELSSTLDKVYERVLGGVHAEDEHTSTNLPPQQTTYEQPINLNPAVDPQVDSMIALAPVNSYSSSSVSYVSKRVFSESNSHETALTSMDVESAVAPSLLSSEKYEPPAPPDGRDEDIRSLKSDDSDNQSQTNTRRPRTEIYAIKQLTNLLVEHENMISVNRGHRKDGGRTLHSKLSQNPQDILSKLIGSSTKQI